MMVRFNVAIKGLKLRKTYFTQLGQKSSSSRMRVIYHNWSATKQRPHPQSVAGQKLQPVTTGTTCFVTVMSSAAN